MMALNFGSLYTKSGISLGTGNTFLFNNTTTKKTKVETAAIILKISLSFIATKVQIIGDSVFSFLLSFGIQQIIP